MLWKITPVIPSLSDQQMGSELPICNATDSHLTLLVNVPEQQAAHEMGIGSSFSLVQNLVAF